MNINKKLCTLLLGGVAVIGTVKAFRGVCPRCGEDNHDGLENNPYCEYCCHDIRMRIMRRSPSQEWRRRAEESAQRADRAHVESMRETGDYIANHVRSLDDFMYFAACLKLAANRLHIEFDPVYQRILQDGFSYVEQNRKSHPAELCREVQGGGVDCQVGQDGSVRKFVDGNQHRLIPLDQQLFNGNQPRVQRVHDEDDHYGCGYHGGYGNHYHCW